VDARVAARGLRSHAARGTIVTAAFQIGLAGLLLLRRLVVAAFLTAEEFGIWGLLLATLLLVLFIKNVGIADKYVQQADADQERAFQQAFTIDLLLGALATLLALIALPIFALAYGHGEIIVPGMVCSLAILGNSLQSPVWIFYRRMDFVRQRTLQAVDPVVAFVVTVALAIAGTGYWCLVIGGVVGAFSGGLVALRACPYRLKLRLDGATARDYFSFSWPLVIANGGGIAIGQLSLLIATRTVGLGGTGAIGLANSISAFTDGVDAIVTQTLYPGICAVRKRADLLLEAFVKSNRLALMWGMPFGIGLALFAPDLVHFVFGDRWEPAVIVMQSFGIVAAIDQLGFNWTAFMRALNRTRPLAAMAVVNLVAFGVITVPLFIAFGLDGFALGFLLAQIVTLVARTYFLSQLFEQFRIVRQAARAVAPIVLPVALILVARWIEAGERTAVEALGEAVAFALTTLVMTIVLERRLLLEILGYVRGGLSPVAAPADDGGSPA
jgi:O-antigen/teichoic acid export membrane protein